MGMPIGHVSNHELDHKENLEKFQNIQKYFYWGNSQTCNKNVILFLQFFN